MGNAEHKTMTEAAALVWLAEVFQEPVESLKPERARDQIAMWDSLGVLTLMAELDEKFDLVVSDQEMRAMAKVGDVLALLRQNGKLSA
jgi:acyl carrier protein